MLFIVVKTTPVYCNVFIMYTFIVIHVVENEVFTISQEPVDFYGYIKVDNNNITLGGYV